MNIRSEKQQTQMQELEQLSIDELLALPCSQLHPPVGGIRRIANACDEKEAELTLRWFSISSTLSTLTGYAFNSISNIHAHATGRMPIPMFNTEEVPLSYLIRVLGGNIEEVRGLAEGGSEAASGIIEKYLGALSRIWDACGNTAYRLLPSFAPMFDYDRWSDLNSDFGDLEETHWHYKVSGNDLFLVKWLKMYVRFLTGKPVGRRGYLAISAKVRDELGIQPYLDAMRDGIPIDDILA